jgi:RimJ/RimL family protein N-acetyltransferase
MLVRKLIPADANAYRELRLFALRESPAAFGASYDQESHQAYETYLARFHASIQDHGNFMVGAFEPDGRLAGIAGLQTYTALKSRHKGFLWGVFVHPRARRQGVGRQLVQEIVAGARQTPALEQIVTAVVTANVHASRLYAAAGFRSYGCEPRALKVDGQSYDEDLLFLDLLAKSG